MHQTAIQLRARAHLDHAVMHVALHPRVLGQFDAFAGMDVADHLAVDHRHRHADLALDAALARQRQRGRLAILGQHAPDDAALHVELARETHVAADHRVRADQGIEQAAFAPAGFASEHHHLPPLSSMRLWSPRVHGNDWSTGSPPRKLNLTRCGTNPAGRITLPSSCWK